MRVTADEHLMLSIRVDISYLYFYLSVLGLNVLYRVRDDKFV